MSNPVLQPVRDRISFGPSTPTITDQIILAPSQSGQYLYVGPPSLITTDSSGAITSVQPQSATVSFDVLNNRLGIQVSSPSAALHVQGTAIATTFQGSFQGNGANIINIPFTNLSGRIASSQFSFNSIPLLSLAQFGTLGIASGRIVISNGDFVSPVASIDTIQSTDIFTSNLTVYQNFTLCNINANNIYGNSIQTPTFQASNGYVAIFQAFSISNDNTYTREIKGEYISTNLVYGDTLNTPVINILDTTTNAYLPITSASRRLAYNGVSLLDQSDIIQLTTQVNGVISTFVAYSTLNTQVFTTALLNAVRQNVSTSFLSNVQASQITVTTLRATAAEVNSLGTSSFTVSTIVGSRANLDYIRTQQADIPSISSTRSFIQQVQISTLSSATANLGLYSGTLNDAMTTQVQIYVNSLESIEPTATFIDIRGLPITVQLPLSTDRSGRILILKDTQGVASRTQPISIQTTSPDTIEGYGNVFTLQQRYGYLVLEASPSGSWFIISANQFDSITTQQLTISTTTFTTNTIAATPLLVQTTGNQSLVVGQKTPLLTQVFTLSNSINIQSSDLGTYFFLTNLSPSQIYTVFLPQSNTLVNGWHTTFYFNSNSSNYISIQDSDTGQFKFLLDVVQSRQIVYTNGAFYSVGGLPPYGIF